MSLSDETLWSRILEVVRQARWRVRTPAIDAQDVAQDMLHDLHAEGVLESESMSSDDFEKTAGKKTWTVFRRYYRRLQREKQLGEEHNLADEVRSIDPMLSAERAELVGIALQAGSLEEAAALVRIEVGETHGPAFEKHRPGITMEIDHQASAGAREKARLRKVKERFVNRLFAIFAALVGALLITVALVVGASCWTICFSTESGPGSGRDLDGCRDFKDEIPLKVASKSCRRESSPHKFQVLSDESKPSEVDLGNCTLASKSCRNHRLEDLGLSTAPDWII